MGVLCYWLFRLLFSCCLFFGVVCGFRTSASVSDLSDLSDHDTSHSTVRHHRLQSILSQATHPLLDTTTLAAKRIKARELLNRGISCHDSGDLKTLFTENVASLKGQGANELAVMQLKYYPTPRTAESVENDYHYWYRMSEFSCLDISYEINNLAQQKSTGCFAYSKIAKELQKVQTRLKQFWKLLPVYDNAKLLQAMSQYALYYYDEFSVGQMFSGLPPTSYTADTASNEKRIVLSLLAQSLAERIAYLAPADQPENVLKRSILTGTHAEGLEPLRKLLVGVFDGIETAILKKALVCYPTLMAATGLYRHGGLTEHTFYDNIQWANPAPTQAQKDKVLVKWQSLADAAPLVPTVYVPNVCGRLAVNKVLQLSLTNYRRTSDAFPASWPHCLMGPQNPATPAEFEVRCRWTTRCITEALRRVAAEYPLCRGANPSANPPVEGDTNCPAIRDNSAMLSNNAAQCRIQDVPRDRVDP